MAFTQQEASNFYQRGREIVTQMADAADDIRAYARVFEIRGGRLGMGDEFGLPTEEIVVFHNALRDFLAANNNQWQNVLDKYRGDY